MSFDIKKFNKKLVSIRINESNTEMFNVGYIIEIDDYDIILERISPDGLNDGILLIRKQDVFLIEIETEYLSCLEKVIQGFIPQKTSKNNEILTDNDIFIESLVNQKIILIKLIQDFDIMGIVINNDEEFIELKIINLFGSQDGQAIVKKEDVKNVLLNSIELQKIEFLYKN